MKTTGKVVVHEITVFVPERHQTDGAGKQVTAHEER